MGRRDAHGRTGGGPARVRADGPLGASQGPAEDGARGQAAPLLGGLSVAEARVDERLSPGHHLLRVVSRADRGRQVHAELCAKAAALNTTTWFRPLQTSHCPVNKFAFLTLYSLYSFIHSSTKLCILKCGTPMIKNNFDSDSSKFYRHKKNYCMFITPDNTVCGIC